jgi:hypothetical protein
MLSPEDPDLRKLRLLQERSNILWEKLDGVRLEMNDLVAELYRRVASDPSSLIVEKPGINVVCMANSLDILRLPDGNIMFSFDNRRAFRLPAQMADLLIYLSEANPGKKRSMDNLVGWRTREDLRAHLQESSKTTLTSHSVASALTRLKMAILKLDGRELILSNQRGLRLAVKRGGVRDPDKPSSDWPGASDV